MPVWIIQVLAGAGGGILIIFAWVFLWGKSTGKINTRLNNVEKIVEERTILPECNEIFTDIKEGVAELRGNVQAILALMTEDKKSKEKDTHPPHHPKA